MNIHQFFTAEVTLDFQLVIMCLRNIIGYLTSEFGMKTDEQRRQLNNKEETSIFIRDSPLRSDIFSLCRIIYHPISPQTVLLFCPQTLDPARTPHLQIFEIIMRVLSFCSTEERKERAGQMCYADFADPDLMKEKVLDIISFYKGFIDILVRANGTMNP